MAKSEKNILKSKTYPNIRFSSALNIAGKYNMVYQPALGLFDYFCIKFYRKSSYYNES